MIEKLSDALSQFVADLRFADVPEEAVSTIVNSWIDTFGVMLAGATSPATQLLIKTLQLSGGESTVLGSPSGARADEAALVNGTSAHALDYDDVAQRAFGHPSAFLVPAIFAEAQAIGANGADMVTAYAAGYEVISEIANHEIDIGRYHDKGWHPAGVFGPIGAAAACASLRKLTRDEVAMCLSLAASMSSGLMANSGSMTKPLHAGRAAQSGVLAARLVASGFTADRHAIEQKPGFMTAFSWAGRIDDSREPQLGRTWSLCTDNKISIKKYPTCYGTHRSIDGAFECLSKLNFDNEDVERIEVFVSQKFKRILDNDSPRTALEAKFSVQFAVAAPLIARVLGMAQLSEDFVSRDDLQSLMKKVQIVVDETYNAERPGYAAADRVKIFCKDGVEVDSGPIYIACGDSQKPLSDSELFQKFEECLYFGGYSAAQVHVIHDALKNLVTLATANDLALKINR